MIDQKTVIVSLQIGSFCAVNHLVLTGRYRYRVCDLL